MIEFSTRVPQPVGDRGSLKWIQRAINERWPSLDQPIMAKLPGASSIEWLSPLESDEFAEYRDTGFLDLIRHTQFAEQLRQFWPAGGPQWDGLGRSDRGHVLLIEAKAHVKELCSPPTASSGMSKERITQALGQLASRLEARVHRAAWTDFFYQFANRLAHLDFLRTQNVPAYLVLVNFLNDSEMRGPSSVEAWEAACEIMFHVMGLKRRHALAQFVLHVYPNVVMAGR